MAQNNILNFYNVAQKREFARDFMFEVQTLGPLSVEDLIYVKTASLPARTITNQQVPFMGLKFNIPGSVTYDGSESWTVHFLCDEAHNIRRKILGWQDAIFNIGISGKNYGTPRISSATFRLLKKDRAEGAGDYAKYTFWGIYPTKVGEIQYDVSADGKPLEFDVTFAYQFWTDSTSVDTGTLRPGIGVSIG